MILWIKIFLVVGLLVLEWAVTSFVWFMTYHWSLTRKVANELSLLSLASHGSKRYSTKQLQKKAGAWRGKISRLWLLAGILFLLGMAGPALLFIRPLGVFDNYLGWLLFIPYFYSYQVLRSSFECRAIAKEWIALHPPSP